MTEEKVKALAENVNDLLRLHERRAETYRDLFALCLIELRKSKRFIDMSAEERQHRKELIDALEKLTTI